MNFRDRARPSWLMMAVGLSVIAFGALMLFGNFGIVDFRSLVFHYWPVPLIVIGVTSLLQPGWRWTSLLWIVIPAFLYAKQHRWIDFNLWTVLPPTIMLIAGSAILYRAFVGPAPRSSLATESADYIRHSAIFSGTDLRPTSQTITGGELTSVLGGVKLDLSSADIPDEGATLDMFLVLGGMELHLPSHWKVQIEAQAVLSGISDLRRPTAEDKVKTLRIRGFVLLGGIEIRN